MKEIKKKQHYYPRCLLKHFADDNQKVHEYNVRAKVFRYVKYDSICYHNYTYEAGKNSSTADNLLEDQFAQYEAKVGPIVENIIEHCLDKDFRITTRHRKDLIDYFLLQTIRTDAGRLKFMNNLKYRWGYEKEGVVTNEEIVLGESKIREFNEIYKSNNGLKQILEIYEKGYKHLNLKIGVTNAEIITSDTPTLTSLGKDKNSLVYYMPISSNLVLIFEYKKAKIIYDFEELVFPVHYSTVNWINLAVINTANYSIISKNDFNVALAGYIKKVFEKSNVKSESPFEIVF